MSDPSPPGACRAADSVERLLRGTLAPAARAELRAHLEKCADCRESYRAAVAAAAAVGRGRRREREAVERVARKEVLRRAAVAAGSRPGRGLRWRTLVYPAVVAASLVHLGDFTARAGGWTLHPLEGRTHSGDAQIDAPGEGIRVGQGEWCRTEPAASAQLTAGAARARLLGDTRVLVERVAPPRLRLERGALELCGTWRVASPAGVVELDEASARLVLEAGELSVEVREGAGRVIGPDGVREVPAAR